MKGAESAEEYLSACEYVLIMMGVAVVWNELLVRIFKIKFVFPLTVRQFFTYLSKNRFITYAALILSFEPILIYYCLQFYPLLPKLLPLLIFILPIILFVLSILLLIFQAQRMGELRSMRKFLFLFLCFKWVGIFASLGQYLSEY